MKARTTPSQAATARVAAEQSLLRRFASLATRLFRGRKFFTALMVFFVVESLWIAFSAAYPQAFDEQFHLGIIQIYSHHWLPFLSHEPPNAAQFGGVARDPSYLYHYLMSFPYRVIAHFDHELIGQVIALRIINIGLFGLGLVLFRRVLLRARASAALTNVSLSIFVLIPIVPQLAAQINYDNLLLPLVAWMCLLTFDVFEAIQKRKPFLRNLVVLLSVGLLTCLVKFPFLPIFLGAVLFVALVLWRQFRGRLRQLGPLFRNEYHLLSGKTRVLLVLLFAVSLGLFSQRYVVNMIEYKQPVPDCASVLSVQQCEAYAPWARNYNDSLHRTPPSNVVVYTGEWFYGLWYRLFFAVNGEASGYVNYPSLPLPSLTAIFLTFAGVGVVAHFWRQTFRKNNYLAFFFMIVLFYCTALWLDNYAQYLKTGQPVAINGRYLLPVLLPAAAIIGRAISIAARKRPLLKPLLATAVLLLFLNGGGVFTFISRSDQTWYWPNKAVQRVNSAAQRILSPVLIESGNKFY